MPPITSKKNPRKGDCFEAAGKLILEFKMVFANAPEGYGEGPEVVHGLVTGQGPTNYGKRITHGWVELGDMVLDFSNGRRSGMSKAEYYHLGQINPAECDRYTMREACQQMDDLRHYGPWSERLLNHWSGEPQLNEKMVTEMESAKQVIKNLKPPQ